MLKNRLYNYVSVCCIALMATACLPPVVQKEASKAVPDSYNGSRDTVNTAKVKWEDFFKDPYLNALIDTALKNNQGLNIIMQDIKVANNEIRARKGMYLPFLNILGGVGADKQGQYTRLGAIDATIPIRPGQPNPAFMPDYLLAASVSWQVDIWKQLRNAKKAAVYRYLSSVEGRNFMVTNLIAQIGYAYYELMALDNQVNIIKANIEIQQNALNLVTLEKAAGQVTELAVLRFQAEVRKNQSRQYYYEQRIIETQNTINFLVGRFPRITERNSQTFNDLKPDTLYSGIPSQLLENRTDVRQAEMDLVASKLDVKVAKANFYPTFNITGGLGYETFNAKFFLTTPQSMLVNLAGMLVAPVVNRNALKATYLSANAKQIKAAYNFERTILNAYTEVANQQSNIINLNKSYGYKSQQVDALNRSINISISLFKTGRADYVEILMTQRDVLEAKIELIETKKQQMNAMVKMYEVLGGGWR